MELISMQNILITGSKGFIGKNLVSKLELDPQYNILEFKRNNTLDELTNLVLKSDFIYHTAGEVRPTSSDEEFEESNVTLTRIIVDLLVKHKKNTPILLVSSIHAEFQKNTYGKTKREAELLIEGYAKDNGSQSIVYRLPHVFGEGCKPNYNSVISTWIYNSINNIEINVFDNSFMMHYIYVQDIVVEFVEQLKIKEHELYAKPMSIYDVTLGEVVEKLNEFKNNMDNPSYKAEGSEFKEKLFDTYNSYKKVQTI